MVKNPIYEGAPTYETISDLKSRPHDSKCQGEEVHAVSQIQLVVGWKVWDLE